MDEVKNLSLDIADLLEGKPILDAVEALLWCLFSLGISVGASEEELIEAITEEISLYYQADRKIQNAAKA